jgi:outer membrane lipoprotein-sorting protein
MWVKGKFYRPILIKKLFFLLKIFFIYQISTSICLADLQKKIINKLTATKTLTFSFKQKIADNEEEGNCFIKYPLLMKCNYKNLKEKTIISNGKTVAIIKKKYKKIYLYPVKSTPLFFILQKEKLINLVKKNKPTKISEKLIEFIFIDKRKNKVRIIFDKNSSEIRGWKTKDAYSNNVSFEINSLIINNQIVDNFFKIPQEEDL